MIRIGIVGCGRILAAHLRGYRLLREAGVDDFRITALCARRDDDARMYIQRGAGPPQREPVSQAAGDPLAVGDQYLSDFQDDVPVRVFTDYRRMIEQGPIDAVNDFTSHALHAPIATAAFVAGKHLMTQKPVAATLAEARRMCQLAEQRERVFSVFENARFRLDTRALGWLFQTQLCGELQMVLMTNVGNWWAPDRIVAGTPWRHRRADGGGLALDIGVHLVHHLRYVAGELETVSAQAATLQPERVTRDRHGTVVERVMCDADDTLFAHFTTSRGVVGNLSLSWTGHGAPLKTGAGRGMAYFGTAGSADDQQVDFDDGRRTPLGELYAQHCSAEIRQRHFPLGLSDAFALNQMDWLDAIRNRRKPETSGREGLRDLAAAEAMLISSRTGRTVHVAELIDQ